MGANTMVAAIGLVLGPVLGGALVGISWHWVFWFNVPLALAGAAWGAVILRELAKHDGVRGFDLAGTARSCVGLTGLVLAVSRGGAVRLERPDRDRRLRDRRRAAADLGGDRAPRARADARPHDLQAIACSPPRASRRSSTGSFASR
jgi:MFS family permease